MNALRGIADEGVRYFAASALALAVDFGTYSGLIRLAGVDYLVAAPVGFSLGIVLIYLLCVRWVFRHRRLRDARAEFALFAGLCVLPALVPFLGTTDLVSPHFGGVGFAARAIDGTVNDADSDPVVALLGLLSDAIVIVATWAVFLPRIDRWLGRAA